MLATVLVAATFGAGGPTVQPYGTAWTNIFYNRGAVNNLDVPFIVPSTVGSDTFGGTARQTRIGIRASLLGVLGGELKAQLETDFYGGLSTTAFGVTKPIPRLRVAALSLEWSKWRVLVGQDWTIVSPLNPATLVHGVVPGFAAAGNLWERAPQLRLEMWGGSKDSLTYGCQAALLAPSDNELQSGSTIPTQGFAVLRTADPIAFSRSPAGEVRAWAGFPMPSGKPAVIGAGIHAHLEQWKLDTGAEAILQSQAFVADLSLPITDFLTLQGEFFVGRNLDNFMGGTFQGVRKTTTTSGTSTTLTQVREVGAIGGWAQLSVSPTDWLVIHVGYGIDDPTDADLVAGMRTRNTQGYGAVVFSPVKWLKVGLEYDWLETQYHESATQTSHHVNIGAAFEF